MAEAAREGPRFPVGWVGRHAVGWWGMLCVIMTEGALFALLLYAYYYDAMQFGRAWLPVELPEFRLSLPNTIVLLLSSAAVWWGERGVKRGSHLNLVLGLAAGFVLGAAFAAIQFLEWRSKPFTIFSDSYGSIYFTLTGFHVAHLVAGLIILLVLLIWSLLRYFDSERYSAVSIGAVYWHFVDAVWITIFFTIYITPRLG